mmetsp:Transcript_101796/g.164115  ORF Transcript_101796/g.164115 Transcript_101796/m.164115 type:complete len:131 (+) Transcript_101796:943-1335(+)
MMEGREERNGRAAGLRLGKIQLYPSAKSHRWLKKKARKKNKTKLGQHIDRCHGRYLHFVASGNVAHQITARCDGEGGVVVCSSVWMWMASWRTINSQAGRREACSMLQHVAAYCNTLQHAPSVETTVKKK